MGRVSFDNAKKMTGGSGSFFKLEDGQKRNVRFLYNTVDEVIQDAYMVHEFTGDKFATVDCTRQDGDALDVCKWCAQGNRPVSRVILPLYDVDNNEITYWKKSQTFVENTLLPAFESIPSNLPISGQVFTLGRTGKTMTDTKYTAAPNLGAPNDGKRKEEFGEVKNPFDLNIIKPNDFEFENTSSANAQTQFTATRKTADIF